MQTSRFVQIWSGLEPVPTPNPYTLSHCWNISKGSEHCCTCCASSSSMGCRKWRRRESVGTKAKAKRTDYISAKGEGTAGFVHIALCTHTLLLLQYKWGYEKKKLWWIPQVSHHCEGTGTNRQSGAGLCSQREAGVWTFTPPHLHTQGKERESCCERFSKETTKEILVLHFIFYAFFVLHICIN